MRGADTINMHADISQCIFGTFCRNRTSYVPGKCTHIAFVIGQQLQRISIATLKSPYCLVENIIFLNLIRKVTHT